MARQWKAGYHVTPFFLARQAAAVDAVAILDVVAPAGAAGLLGRDDAAGHYAAQGPVAVALKTLLSSLRPWLRGSWP